MNNEGRDCEADNNKIRKPDGENMLGMGMYIVLYVYKYGQCLWMRVKIVFFTLIEKRIEMSNCLHWTYAKIPPIFLTPLQHKTDLWQRREKMSRKATIQAKCLFIMHFVITYLISLRYWIMMFQYGFNEEEKLVWLLPLFVIFV